ncbi:zinc ribbon domain-containing protein [Paenibacillus sp. UNC217MF]|uniref:zinc ribbon domain-containing protein n=1 Tax=Paenibacillus sp. UNC217MF TaxID=1449062 RepID=UPI0009DEC50C|nr:zinc ribbon domain-containing protein [Paenibacillus sp. UNC217MF]
MAELKRKNTFFTNIAYCSDCGKGMGYRSNRKGYICGTYARHGNIACTNHAVKEQNLTEVILSDLKAMYDKLNLPDLDAKVKQRINANQKKITKQLQAIDKQIQKQMDIKKNALQKFVSDAITKDDYDCLVTDIEDKLLHFRKKPTSKKMEESYSASKLFSIKEQFKKAVAFDTLTTETPWLRGYNPLNLLLKLAVKHTPHA